MDLIVSRQLSTRVSLDSEVSRRFIIMITGSISAAGRRRTRSCFLTTSVTRQERGAYIDEW